MALILMVAAGVLLAFLLLPLLGPIAMIAISIAVIAWLGYCIFAAIGVGMAAVELTKDAVKKSKDTAKETKAAMEKVKAAQQPSLKARVKAEPAFALGLTSVQELLTLEGLKGKPAGLWYQYVLNDRLCNCCKTGMFRVEDQLNRNYLEQYLEKVVRKGGTAPLPRAQELSRVILKCHDSLSTLYQPKAAK